MARLWRPSHGSERESALPGPGSVERPAGRKAGAAARLSPGHSVLLLGMVVAAGLFADLQWQLVRAGIGPGRDPLDDQAGFDALEGLISLKLPVAMLLVLLVGLGWVRAGRGLPLPEWLFPVRGRWLRFLLLALAPVLPAAALAVPGPFSPGVLPLLMGAMLVPVLVVRLCEQRAWKRRDTKATR